METVNQGKAIVEYDDSGGGGLLIMLPDGNVLWKENKIMAEGAIKAWFRKNLGPNYKIGIGEIEWRL